MIKQGALVRLSIVAKDRGFYPPSMNGDMVADKPYERANGNVVVDLLCEDGGIRVVYVDDLIWA